MTDVDSDVPPDGVYDVRWFGRTYVNTKVRDGIVFLVTRYTANGHDRLELFTPLADRSVMEFLPVNIADRRVSARRSGVDLIGGWVADETFVPLPSEKAGPLAEPGPEARGE